MLLAIVLLAVSEVDKPPVIVVPVIGMGSVIVVEGRTVRLEERLDEVLPVAVLPWIVNSWEALSELPSTMYGSGSDSGERLWVKIRTNNDVGAPCSNSRDLDLSGTRPQQKSFGKWSV